VDCFDPSDPDRTDEGERGNLTVVARVPVRSPALSGLGLMLATDLGASSEDGVVNEVRKESAMPRAWSTGLGVVSYDVCTRTEAFQVMAARMLT
jgi:hypothetical protein